MLISDILIDMGKNVSPAKVSMWGSALFGSILIFSIISVMCLPNDLVISDMPLYEMIKGGYISKVYNVLLVIAIITSVTATISLSLNLKPSLSLAFINESTTILAKSSFSLIIGVLIPRTTVPTHLIFITPNKHKFVGLIQQPIY